jgi:hypothetical protein
MKRFKKIFCLAATAMMFAAVNARAQSTFDINVSNAGGGQSLVTWSFTGEIVGAGLTNLFAGPLWIYGFDAGGPGAYTGESKYIDFAGGGELLNVDSGQHKDFIAIILENDVTNSSVVLFLSSIALVANPGEAVKYTSGIESIIVPVDYSNFTPGVYTTTVSSFIFNSFTETLTVGPVPEPSALAMAGLGGACLLLFRRRRH